MEEQLTNSDIADIIQLQGKLLDLHDVDVARAKAYVDSVFSIERLEKPILGMNATQIGQIRGYGKVLQKPILEILETGTTQELQDLVKNTPEGIFDILKVKGLGVKKVKILWKDLGIDNLKSLKAASENGEIAKLKGFGEKSQDSIIESIAFLESLKGKLRLDKALQLSQVILQEIKKSYPETFEVGEVLQRENIISELSFIVVKDGFGGIKLPAELFEQDMKESSPSIWRGNFIGFDINISIEKASSKSLVSRLIIKSSKEEHLRFQNEKSETFLSFLNGKEFATEEDAYMQFGMPYIIPEMRNGLHELEWAEKHNVADIITWDDIKGTVHNHSTYSDGAASLKEMAQACIDLGFAYFGIADHSQTASYAGGLWPETVVKQHKEIEILNAGFPNGFKILKGIESDILPDGSLDYEPEVLKTFDYIVASVHSVLTMDIERATSRLIKAIENPYTSILGHPTGRILLRREGYPIDYEKIIDACAANGVIMELNASPYRLDLDWRWIDYCVQKGVMISINPDAHSIEGLKDIMYGVMIARKAGLTTAMTLNAKPLNELMKILKKG